MVVVDDLAAIEESDRIGPGLAFEVNTDDEAVFGPSDLIRAGEHGVVNRGDGVTPQCLAIAVRRGLTAPDGVVHRVRIGHGELEAGREIDERDGWISLRPVR